MNLMAAPAFPSHLIASELTPSEPRFDHEVGDDGSHT
jgi:hypothetical protein